jgi:hypothetical protein
VLCTNKSEHPARTAGDEIGHDELLAIDGGGIRGIYSSPTSSFPTTPLNKKATRMGGQLFGGAGGIVQKSLKAIFESFAHAQDRITQIEICSCVHDQSPRLVIAGFEMRPSSSFPTTPQNKKATRMGGQLFGGAGGNRTRVRKPSTGRSTYLVSPFDLIDYTPMSGLTGNEPP